jgi:hypothetical protein
LKFPSLKAYEHWNLFQLPVLASNYFSHSRIMMGLYKIYYNLFVIWIKAKITQTKACIHIVLLISTYKLIVYYVKSYLFFRMWVSSLIDIFMLLIVLLRLILICLLPLFRWCVLLINLLVLMLLLRRLGTVWVILLWNKILH